MRGAKGKGGWQDRASIGGLENKAGPVKFAYYVKELERRLVQAVVRQVEAQQLYGCR
jgi:hypothetical protein